MMSYFSEKYGCDAAPISSTIADKIADDNSTVERKVYNNCKNSALEYWVVHGGGHTLPGATEIEDLGVTNRDIDARAEIWAFLSKFQLKS